MIRHSVVLCHVLAVSILVTLFAGGGQRLRWRGFFKFSDYSELRKASNLNNIGPKIPELRREGRGGGGRMGKIFEVQPR